MVIGAWYRDLTLQMLVLIKDSKYQHPCFSEGEMRSYDQIGEHTAKFRKASECWLVGVLLSAERG